MNQFIKYLTILVFAGIIISCGKTRQTSDKNIPASDESVVLYNFLEKSGDMINSEKVPFLVPADEVWENKSNYLVIDIRDTAEYESGHIDGAILVNPKELVNYLGEKANTTAFEKVILACHTGQTASYYTTLLRLIGHSNIFALKFGMSGWSRKITPNKILDNISDKYTAILEKKINTNEKTYDLPKLKTSRTGAYSILLSRVNELAEEGFDPVKIKVDTLMKNPSGYFIVNYWQEAFYNKGHLPGAIQFEPGKSLSKAKMLKILPTDKPIVVYCLSGQTSASVVAWLRVLGYNARSLSLGSNSFMHDFTKSFNDKAFLPSRDIADYEIVEGMNPGLQNSPVPDLNQPSKNDKPSTAVPPVKKKQKSSGGGC